MLHDAMRISRVNLAPFPRPSRMSLSRAATAIAAVARQGRAAPAAAVLSRVAGLRLQGALVGADSQRSTSSVASPAAPAVDLVKLREKFAADIGEFGPGRC